MNLSKLTPKSVFWTGVAVTLVGAALIVVLPTVVYGILHRTIAESQELLALLDIAIRILSVALPPLGGALIAAGVVMTYLDKLEARRSAPERRHEILSGRAGSGD